MMNTQNKKTNTANEKTMVIEGQLYSLLFAGRISVREYLQRLKEAGGKVTAA
jgi:hypothetical protein